MSGLRDSAKSAHKAQRSLKAWHAVPLAAAAIAFSGFFIDLSWDHGVNRASFQSIRIGDKRSDVVTALGLPANHFTGPPGIKFDKVHGWGGEHETVGDTTWEVHWMSWGSDAGGIVVGLDSDDFIISKKFYPPTPKLTWFRWVVIDWSDVTGHEW